MSAHKNSVVLIPGYTLESSGKLMKILNSKQWSEPEAKTQASVPFKSSPEDSNAATGEEKGKQNSDGFFRLFGYSSESGSKNPLK